MPYFLQKNSIKAGVKAFSILYTGLSCGDLYVLILSISCFNIQFHHYNIEVYNETV